MIMRTTLDDLSTRILCWLSCLSIYDISALPRIGLIKQKAADRYWHIDYRVYTIYTNKAPKKCGKSQPVLFYLALLNEDFAKEVCPAKPT